MSNNDLIKKLIVDFGQMIKDHKDKAKHWDDICSEKTVEMGNLRLAMTYVSEIPTANATLQEKLVKLENYVNDHADRFRRDAHETLDALVKARKAFIEVIQKNCEHDFEFKCTDFHKGEDTYQCRICGKET